MKDKVKIAMQITGQKYFSQLTSKQKDNTINSLLMLKYNLTGLPLPVVKTILSDIVSKENIESQLKGQRFFKHGNTYYPMNFKSIITS